MPEGLCLSVAVGGCPVCYCTTATGKKVRFISAVAVAQWMPKRSGLCTFIVQPAEGPHDLCTCMAVLNFWPAGCCAASMPRPAPACETSLSASRCHQITQQWCGLRLVTMSRCQQVDHGQGGGRFWFCWLFCWCFWQKVACYRGEFDSL